ncbi:Chaperone protein DnaJ [Symmachiella macrocystis]|uniref:Chaperone protein DnaJ n=2 Tax=Symmachiella macrocystis TaxID=2527985 RepID=A0A5C6BRB5_9PLAN|nr:Chaperone protein DnaJ [Symmachiella macrocystis]
MAVMATKRDYYEVLGVAKEAGGDEIKKAYRKEALANHPDRNPGDGEAEQRFKDAAEAFEILGDEQKRARYDRYGHAGVQGLGGGAGFTDINDIFDSFGDMLGGIFGGARTGQPGAGRRPARGRSLRTGITVTLLEAARGCTRELDVRRHENCDTCGGSGAKAGSIAQPCDYCDGRGQVVQSQGFFRIQTTCPACSGDGVVVRDKCENCGGSGRESKTAQLEVKVPPGVDNDMQLCLRGEGEPGALGGPRGDLYVDIHVKEHSLFQRDGNTLTCLVPITYTQAALGAEIEVPILTGRHDLKVPAGTQTGTEFRLRGLGMPDPHGRGTGDMLVEVQVDVPKKLTERQEELLRELAELEEAHVSPHRKSFFETLKDYFTGEDEET